MTEVYETFWARLIQHEYDHLQGIVNLDKAKVGTIEYRFGDGSVLDGIVNGIKGSGLVGVSEHLEKLINE